MDNLSMLKFIPRKGLNLFTFNYITKDLTLIDKSKPIIFDNDCYYFEALNFKSAEKKVRNYYKNRNKKLENLRYVTKNK